MIFVDASAIVAILAQEPEIGLFLGVLQGPEPCATSALAVYEATLALRRLKPSSLAVARLDVTELLSDCDINLVPIGEAEQDAALDAFERYGKGTGHPAKLNMGDCFAYACARTNNAALLYKGEDFALTDIKAAASRAP